MTHAPNIQGPPENRRLQRTSLVGRYVLHQCGRLRIIVKKQIPVTAVLVEVIHSRETEPVRWSHKRLTRIASLTRSLTSYMESETHRVTPAIHQVHTRWVRQKRLAPVRGPDRRVLCSWAPGRDICAGIPYKSVNVCCDGNSIDIRP